MWVISATGLRTDSSVETGVAVVSVTAASLALVESSVISSTAGADSSSVGSSVFSLVGASEIFSSPGVSLYSSLPEVSIISSSSAGGSVEVSAIGMVRLSTTGLVEASAAGLSGFPSTDLLRVSSVGLSGFSSTDLLRVSFAGVIEVSVVAESSSDSSSLSGASIDSSPIGDLIRVSATGWSG